MHHAEDRGIGANHQCECRDDNERKPRCAGHHTEAVAHIAQQSLDGREGPHVAGRFTDLLHATGFDQRRAPRCVRRHAARDVACGEFVDEQMQLIVQVAIPRPPPTRPRALPKTPHSPHFLHPPPKWACPISRDEPRGRSACRETPTDGEEGTTT